MHFLRLFLLVLVVSSTANDTCVAPPPLFNGVELLPHGKALTLTQYVVSLLNKSIKLWEAGKDEDADGVLFPLSEGTDVQRLVDLTKYMAFEVEKANDANQADLARSLQETSKLQSQENKLKIKMTDNIAALKGKEAKQLDAKERVAGQRKELAANQAKLNNYRKEQSDYAAWGWMIPGYGVVKGIMLISDLETTVPALERDLTRNYNHFLALSGELLTLTEEKLTLQHNLSEIGGEVHAAQAKKTWLESQNKLLGKMVGEAVNLFEYYGELDVALKGISRNFNGVSAIARRLNGQITIISPNGGGEKESTVREALLDVAKAWDAGAGMCVGPVNTR
jgi:predicted  nucleic acid-binding Zn-ribbon protein